jgi:hypothetical protein
MEIIRHRVSHFLESLLGGHAYNNLAWSHSDHFSSTGTSVCYKNTLTEGYSQYGCGTTDIGETLVTSFTGINPQFSIQIVMTGGVLESEAAVTLISATPTTSKNLPTPHSTTPSMSPSTKSPQEPSSTPSTPSSITSSSPSSGPHSSTNPIGSQAPTSSGLGTVVQKSSSTGLSSGAKIGIGIAAAAIAAIAFTILFLFCWRRHKKNRDSQLPSPPYQENPNTNLYPVAELDQTEYYQVLPQKVIMDAASKVEAKIPSTTQHGANSDYSSGYPPSQTNERDEPRSRVVSGGMLSQISAISPESVSTAVFSDAHELPVTPSPRLTAASMVEIDGSERQSQTHYMPYSKEETVKENSEVRRKDEEHLAGLRSQIETVRAEKERLLNLRQLEEREAELKEKIMELQRRTME